MRKPKLVSLFAGIGGFDLGFERAGFEVAGHVEIDKWCSQVLQEKWPNAINAEDVRFAGAKETTLQRALKVKRVMTNEWYEKRIKKPKTKPPTTKQALEVARKHTLPRCDIITLGFPCQDLSVAGKRKGLEGERSGLFYEALRIIDELKPTWAIWENVPGLLSSDGGRDLARVMFSMVEHGYSGCYRVLDSQWFGVAQRRRRLFGVFARGDSGAERAAKVLSISEGLRWHPAPSREEGQRAAVYTEGSFGGWREGCGTLKASGQGMEHLVAFQGQVSDSRWSAEVAPTLNAHFGDKQGLEDQHALNGAGLFVPTHEQPIYFEPRFTRISSGAPQQDGVASTLLSGHHGGDGTPHIAGQVWGVRRLTPIECERLQGFPDDWAASLSDAQRYKALGNAVTVNVAEWIAKRLIKEIENDDMCGNS